MTVAVATGKYSREELASHHPDFLFDDFSDPNAVMAAIAPRGNQGFRLKPVRLLGRKSPAEARRG